MIDSDREDITTEDFTNILKEIADVDTTKENLIKKKVGRPRKEKVEKPKRVLLTDEQKKERARERRKERYDKDTEYRLHKLEITKRSHAKNAEAKKAKEKEYYERTKETRKDDIKERNKKQYSKVKEIISVFSKLKNII
jgi:hypothetical protein